MNAKRGEKSSPPIGGIIALKGAIIELYILTNDAKGSFLTLNIGIQLSNTTISIIKYIIAKIICVKYETITFPL